MKRCIYCHVEKPVGDYYKNRSKYDGIGNVCKSCKSQVDARWRAANPDYMKRYKLQQILKNREVRHE